MAPSTPVPKGGTAKEGWRGMGSGPQLIVVADRGAQAGVAVMIRWIEVGLFKLYGKYFYIGANAVAKILQV